jgi:hypothetical protein
MFSLYVATGFKIHTDPIYFLANTYMKEITYVHHGFDLSTCVGNRNTFMDKCLTRITCSSLY